MGPGWIKLGLELLEGFSGITGLFEERVAYKRATIPMQEAEHAENVRFRALVRDLKSLKMIDRKLIKRLVKVRNQSARYNIDFEQLLEHYDVTQIGQQIFQEEEDIIRSLPGGAKQKVVGEIRRWRKTRQLRRIAQ